MNPFTAANRLSS